MKVRASGEVLRVSTEKLTAEGTEDVETSAEATAGATTEGAHRHHIREREPNVRRVSGVLLGRRLIVVVKVRWVGGVHGVKAEDDRWRVGVDAIEVDVGEVATKGVTQVEGTSDESPVCVKRGTTAVATVTALDC